MSDLSTAPPAPGWYDDPWRHAELRYWSGSTWTADVARRARPPRPPHPTLPLIVAVGTLGVTLAALIASRFLLDALSSLDLPIAIYVVIGGVLGYGPIVAYAWWAGRRWGNGSLRDTTGFHFRAADTGWGPVTWLCCLAAEIVVGIVVVVTGIPITSNTEGLDEVPAERGYVIALLVLAVVAAPLVEELAFRGLVLRGLLSRFGAVAAIAIQALLFGMAHFDPVRGTGNIGLVLVLSGVGAVLGGAEYLFRRLGPAIIAHGILNAVALTIVLSGWSTSV